MNPAGKKQRFYRIKNREGETFTLCTDCYIHSVRLCPDCGEPFIATTFCGFRGDSILNKNADYSTSNLIKCGNHWNVLLYEGETNPSDDGYSFKNLAAEMGQAEWYKRRLMADNEHSHYQIAFMCNDCSKDKDFTRYTGENSSFSFPIYTREISKKDKDKWEKYKYASLRKPEYVPNMIVHV
jgi:hypothetical protein